MRKLFLGVDVGAASTKMIIIDEFDTMTEQIYIKTHGSIVEDLKKCFRYLKEQVSKNEIHGLGITGSGRNLAGTIIGADISKNEITTQGVAAAWYYPEVKTVIEIGGHTSKLILLSDGVIYKTVTNNPCSTCIGSFIEHQAERFCIPTDEFYEAISKSTKTIEIECKCATITEGEIIQKQQLGYNVNDIIKGLCIGITKNYIKNFAKGITLKGPILMQGGVALNTGIVKAFSMELDTSIIVPIYPQFMGAIGAAILAKDEYRRKGHTKFKGFNVVESDILIYSLECIMCSKACEVINIEQQGKVLDILNDKCGKYQENFNIFSGTRCPTKNIKISGTPCP